jgi:molecular chaperone HtpG
MTIADAPPTEARPFEADVARLLHLMVHSVYSDKDVFLRELISNAADACEKLRYEAIANPALLGDDPKARITLTLDPDNRTLVVEDNGIGMSQADMAEALGTIARSGTRAFMERIETAQAAREDSKDAKDAQLIGQFGVGFYSAFMVADRVDVFSRAAGGETAAIWSSDGKGSFTIGDAPLADAPARGTRVVLHLMEDAKTYAERHTIERIVRNQSGHVPVPIAIVAKPGEEAAEIADGAALWTRPKAEISKEDYADFYRSVAGQFDEPALIVHFRAEGRHDYTALAFVPSTKPFDLFDPDRRGRIKLYVRRVFITDEADVLPRYLRFVRGIVDSSDLPLNMSREMIQESSILAAIRKGATNRIIGDIEKLAEKEPDRYKSIWETFGAVLKEGLYEDFERRQQLLKLARFRTTTSAGEWRGITDYVASLRENQTAIYYIAGEDATRIETSPQLEGFRARGVEVLLLSDPVDSFWVTTIGDFDGKPFKSVTQGGADLALIPRLDAQSEASADTSDAVKQFVDFVKTTLGDGVSDVRASDRLTESAVCLVATEHGPDRQLERILAGTGQLPAAAKPILEINPRHALIEALAAVPASETSFREDAAHMLLDDARVLDGERPADSRAFSARLARILTRGMV